MNRPDSTSLEEQFPLWLAACDEALAEGAEPASLYGTTADEAVRGRLEREVAWCQLVRQLWTHLEPDTLPPTITVPALPLQSLGRFQLRRELGRGTFGVVFLAYDPHLGRDVALKVPRA